jgi:hypothetical protein
MLCSLLFANLYCLQRLITHPLQIISLPSITNTETEFRVREIAYGKLSEKQTDTMIRIINCESKFNGDDINYKNKKGRGVDEGYLQWNSVYHPEVIKECFGKSNQLECEINNGIRVIKKRGFKEWRCAKYI